MVSMNQASAHARVVDLKIFIKDVRDRRGKKRPITVRSWATIKDVKDQLQKLLHVPPSSQRLYLGPIIVPGKELSNHRSLHDAGIYKSGETLLLDIKGGVVDDVSSTSYVTSLRPSSNDICILSSMYDDAPRALRKIVQQARRGFSMGLKPDLVLDGTGGTYFLHDARKFKVAVFKPGDEEPYAENNPRGYVKQVMTEDVFDDLSMRAGVKPGESCLREVAAYLLDHDGFSGVPLTTLAEAKHPAFNTNGAGLTTAAGGASMGRHSLISSTNNAPTGVKKVGSVQEYVHAECTMDDLSPSKLDVDEVHKIAILDIRLMNADRNAANLLCKRRSDNALELVPIDHGLCLRTACDVAWFDWCWLDWPQLKKPVSKKSREYILSLDVEDDAHTLKERFNISEEALDLFRASNKILRTGIEMGLTLYDIATMCCRNDNAGELKSNLEKITSQAADLASVAVENGKWHHSAASRAIEDQLQENIPLRNVGSGIKKFKSMVDFASLLCDNVVESAVPASLMTSASESGSEIGDIDQDQDECEKWASLIIADVQIDDDDLSQRSRSSSIESNSSVSSSKLSSSPVGFWYVRPSTVPTVTDANESWSPSSSPVESPLLERAMFRHNSSITSKRDIATDGNELFSSMTFDALMIDHEDIKYSQGPQMLKKKSSGLVRSQSFTALSSKHSTGSEATTGPNLSYTNKLGRVDENHEKYHVYLLKFIDLLIERESRARSVQIGTY